ncbi:MAG: sensor histidine kinase [Ignavibacteriaceae bacterium]
MKLIQRAATVFLVVIVLFFLFYFIYDLDLVYSFVDAVISSFIFLALSAGFEYTAKFVKLNLGELMKFIIIHLVAALVVSFIMIQSSGFLIQTILRKFEVNNLFFDNSIIERFLIVALLYLLVISYYYLMIYYENYREKVREEAELKNLVTEAEIKTLKFQINPHFIFNSLNSIAALTSIDPEKARDMVIKLADFLRYTLSTNSKQMNSLRDEISNIEKYLSIEKIRFGERFNYDFDIPEQFLDILVPNMVLQPVFENAIKYGVYQNLGTTGISVVARSDNGYLTLITDNTLEEEPKKELKGEGVGLKNIQERLRLIYGQTNLLITERWDNIFRVILKIPVKP